MFSVLGDAHWWLRHLEGPIAKGNNLLKDKEGHGPASHAAQTDQRPKLWSITPPG
jgi:hypothetical protein